MHGADRFDLIRAQARTGNDGPVALWPCGPVALRSGTAVSAKSARGSLGVECVQLTRGVMRRQPASSRDTASTGLAR